MQKLARGLALAGAIVAWTGLTAPAATASASVSVPATVTPGGAVSVKLNSYEPSGLVQLQFVAYSARPQNCCAAPVWPSIYEGYPIDEDGRATISVKMPRAYARCVSVGCSSPGWTRWRDGDRVRVFVYELKLNANGSPIETEGGSLELDPDAEISSDVARIKCSRLARCLARRK